MNLNKTILSGNLVRNPELRENANGLQICTFSIAVNDRVKDGRGSWIDSPNFIDCVAFGSRAETCDKYLYKGSKIAIEGKLHMSQWTDKNTGQKRSKLEVIIDTLEFMQNKKDNEGSAYIAADDIPF